MQTIELTLPNDISGCHELILGQQNQLEVLQNQLDTFQTQNEVLTREVEELKARLNQNSNNSNRPPSSDGLNKKPAFPRKKGGKRGGQKGHRGKTLEMVEQPDYIIPLIAKECSKCGTDLGQTEQEVEEKRQSFDIPKPKLEVTEFQKMGCDCPNCGTHQTGEFPPEVTAPVQYGMGVRALAVLLSVNYKLPFKKIKEFFADIFGYAVNESTLVQANHKCYEGLEESEKTIMEKLLNSLVAHFDETGLRVQGSLHWLHTCCSSLYTYLFVHLRRGAEALTEAPSLLPDFRGWAIHDCLSGYFKFSKCLHALCGAHLLREFTALTERGVQWASQFKTYLLELYELTHGGTKVLNATQQKQALLDYNRIWNYADQAEPPPKKTGKRGRPKATKGRNLLTRLKKHQAAVLAFAFYEEVPFTNNQAERDLRPAKVKQKVAGSFRTLEGAQKYARIQGFISTTRKHQLNVFNELKSAFSGHTFLTATEGGK